MLIRQGEDFWLADKTSSPSTYKTSRQSHKCCLEVHWQAACRLDWYKIQDIMPTSMWHSQMCERKVEYTSFYGGWQDAVIDRTPIYKQILNMSWALAFLVASGTHGHTFHVYDRQHLLNHSTVCGPPSRLIVTLAIVYQLPITTKELKCGFVTAHGTERPTSGYSLHS
jgi:hypothetical protein